MYVPDSLEKIELALNSYEIQNEIALYENKVSNINMKNIACINCMKTGGCRRHTGYSRYFVTMKNDKVMLHCVKVPRGRCKYCNKTFSILPECAAYSSSYCKSFVLTVMRDYYIHRFENVVSLCEHYQIAVSTLYKWFSGTSFE